MKTQANVISLEGMELLPTRQHVNLAPRSPRSYSHGFIHGLWIGAALAAIAILLIAKI